jgi:maltose alpha-D-glucosyltransferase/alpha-amylase
VETQEKDPASLLNTVKALLRLRNAEVDLRGKPNLEILHADSLPFIYRRGSLLLAVNPGGDRVAAQVSLSGEQVYVIGRGSLENGLCALEGQSFAVWRI